MWQQPQSTVISFIHNVLGCHRCSSLNSDLFATKLSRTPRNFVSSSAIPQVISSILSRHAVTDSVPDNTLFDELSSKFVSHKKNLLENRENVSSNKMVVSEVGIFSWFCKFHTDCLRYLLIVRDKSENDFFIKSTSLKIWMSTSRDAQKKLRRRVEKNGDC